MSDRDDDSWPDAWDDEELAAMGFPADDDDDPALDQDGRPLSGPGSIAAVWQRAVARLIDVFIVFNVAGLLTVAVVRPGADDSSLLSFVIVQTVFLAIAGLYEATMVRWRGQTVGKMLLRIRVVRRSDGARPSPGESVVRFFPWLLLFVPFVGQFAWIIVYLTAIPNARRQGWHDRAASTLVVVAPRPERHRIDLRDEEWHAPVSDAPMSTPTELDLDDPNRVYKSFVILGSMRSGTTLLAQCLNAHPDLVVPDETDFLVPAAFIIDRIPDEALGTRLLGDLITGSARYADSIGRYLDPDAVRGVLAAAPYDVAGVITALYEEVARVAGVPMAGDKSPNDIQFMRILLDTGFYQHVKVIHIVRDVRDIMVSMYRLGWIPRLRYGYPRFWSSDNIFAANRLSGSDTRYHFVRYEDLVRDPTGELEQVCTHLGVPFDPGMADVERRRAASLHPDLPHHERTFSAIDESGIGAFREAFDAESLAHVERLGGEGLRRFGYLT